MRSWYRGWQIVYRGRQWYFEDTGLRVCDCEDIACSLCGEPPTVEGYDACLGHIAGAQFACCGHGVHDGYILWTKREGYNVN